jgi:outer membrane murein-binding lipoprotein Lpp
LLTHRSSQANIKKESTKERDTTAQITQYQEDISNLRSSLTAAQARKEKAEKHLDEVMGSLQESTASIRIELEQSQLELTESDRSVSEIQTEKESLETAIKLVEARFVSQISLCLYLAHFGEEHNLLRNPLTRLKPNCVLW